jgi:cytidine deaminase
MTYDELAKLALKAKEKAYAPYSGFKVGAALITSSGKVFTGVNIENVSFGATNCAERTAVFKAVSEGEKEIEAIAIAGDSVDITYPCGICRQVLIEFCSKDAKIICCRENGDYKIYKLSELLPLPFSDIDK